MTWAHIDRLTRLQVVGAVLGLAGGAVAALAGQAAVADALWAATGVLAAIPLIIDLVGSIRRGEWGLDIIAILAIGGALVLGEYLAAAIVGLMLATGQALDAYAATRAERDLSALLERAPRQAHRLDGDTMTSIPVDDVAVEDRLVVKAGEVVPVDGVVVSGVAVLDESSLTGESAPVSHPPGDRVASGSVNGGDGFQMVAVASAADSAYAGIVRLVQQAHAERPPVARLADRYAIGFVPLALAIAAAAWIASGDPVRALAVLVVATPCPLLLAVPIAVVSGMSRAARRGVVIKGGGVLERLADAEILVIDKTGTLTVGESAVDDIVLFDPSIDADEVLRLAASLDQMSSHVLAAVLVRAARSRGLHLDVPVDVVEVPGAGITGQVAGRTVVVGSADHVAAERSVPDTMRSLRRRADRDPHPMVYVAQDDRIIGVVRLADEIRADTPTALRTLRREGIHTVIMATGDHPVVADAVGSAIGVDRVLAQCTPEEKVDAVRRASATGVTVMVGDGINDAPALATADVGVAMGARGATSSSEAADVVLMVDRLDRLAEAMIIAKRSRRIATESALLGMGLSLVAMGFAAFGYLPPVGGALVQEAIDVIAILSALRALSGPTPWRSGPKLPAALSARLRSEHAELMPRLDEVARVADRLHVLEPGEALADLQRIDALIQHEVIPHERADDLEIYPILAEIIGGEDPMATMSLTHGEIFRLAGVFHRQVADAAEDPEALDLFDVRRTMYGLHAILRLHFAQEEELYQSLDDTYREQPALAGSGG